MKDMSRMGGTLQAPVLTSERIRIEPVSMAHWENYAMAWADPVMTEFIGGNPRTRNESWGKFIGASGLWNLLGYGYWSFLDRNTGANLGCGGLGRFERGLPELEDCPEAGWAFVQNAWGQGFATEAMSAIFAWADCALPLQEIRCMIDGDNKSSARVAEKIGFKFLSQTEYENKTIAILARTKNAAYPYM